MARAYMINPCRARCDYGYYNPNIWEAKAGEFRFEASLHYL